MAFKLQGVSELKLQNIVLNNLECSFVSRSVVDTGVHSYSVFVCLFACCFVNQGPASQGVTINLTKFERFCTSFSELLKREIVGIF